MNQCIVNPYGTEITIFTDGIFFKAYGRNNECYVSKDREGVIAAFVEDVHYDGQIFLSIRSSRNYRAKLNKRLSKQNNEKNVYMITVTKDQLK